MWASHTTKRMQYRLKNIKKKEIDYDIGLLPTRDYISECEI